MAEIKNLQSEIQEIKARNKRVEAGGGNAIIPSVAFVLSTLTVPLFKNWWLKNIYKR